MSKPVISTKTTKMLYRNKLNARQLAVFFCAITMYLFYYFCKSNLSVATEPIQQTFGFSSAQFGIILTTASIVYAAGQFINGFLSDRIGAKAIFFIGAIGAIIGNFCFGFFQQFGPVRCNLGNRHLLFIHGLGPQYENCFRLVSSRKMGTLRRYQQCFLLLG